MLAIRQSHRSHWPSFESYPEACSHGRRSLAAGTRSGGWPNSSRRDRGLQLKSFDVIEAHKGELDQMLSFDMMEPLSGPSLSALNWCPQLWSGREGEEMLGKIGSSSTRPTKYRSHHPQSRMSFQGLLDGEAQLVVVEKPGPQAASKKRVTVASLSESMDQMSETLPMLVENKSESSLPGRQRSKHPHRSHQAVHQH